MYSRLNAIATLLLTTFLLISNSAIAADRYGTPTAANRGSAAFRVSGDFSGNPAVNQFIRKMVTQHGFSAKKLARLFSSARRKQWTLNYLNKGDRRREKRKREGKKPSLGNWSRYRAKFLTKRHISSGAAFWRRYASALRRAEKKYGVPAEYIMGIMGIETIFGANVGNDRVLDALTTLSFNYPRRSDFFTEELESYLLMTRNQGISPTVPKGSFAGAMGLGQFMPTSFHRWAVDFNGDGRIDLWNPVDTIGSIANYFVKHGWRPGESVVTPTAGAGRSAQSLDSGFDSSYSVAALADYGIRQTRTYRADGPVRLLHLTSGGHDQYWLGHQNFYVITRYNHSTYYAMAVHQLAHAIKKRYRGG